MPILNPISVTGHADITDTQNGEWWMVLLAVRPYAGGHYNLGRETFMVPMVWAEDGWPIIDNETGLVNEEERLPNLPRCIYPPMPANDNFESSTLPNAMGISFIRLWTCSTALQSALVISG